MWNVCRASSGILKSLVSPVLRERAHCRACGLLVWQLFQAAGCGSSRHPACCLLGTGTSPFHLLLMVWWWQWGTRKAMRTYLVPFCLTLLLLQFRFSWIKTGCLCRQLSCNPTKVFSELRSAWRSCRTLGHLERKMLGRWRFKLLGSLCRGKTGTSWWVRSSPRWTKGKEKATFYYLFFPRKVGANVILNLMCCICLTQM